MTVLIPTLNVAGEIVNLATGALSVDVTLPNPVSDYVVSGQVSTPTTCWLSGADGNVATFSFGSPVDAGATLTVIAIPAGAQDLTTVVLEPGTLSYAVTAPTGQSVVPICQWNTQVWFQIAGNTWIFLFSSPPGETADFSYLIVGPGQNTFINQQPVDPGEYEWTISTTISDTYLPIGIASWNTAIGLIPDIEASRVSLLFTNGAPSFTATSALVVSIPINISIFPLPLVPTVPVQQPWIVNIISPEDWAARLIFLFPYPWLSDYARSVSGIAYAIFLSIGTELNFISQQMYYAWTACRLQTATNGALDLFAQDYFGNNLPRQPGESDTSYRIRIQALLFQPQVTREAIVNALESAYPGISVRPLEGWNPSDTGYYADQTSGYKGSYYDYDSPLIPSLWGDWTTRYTGYFEIQLPQEVALSYNLWGYDFAAAYDSETGYFFPLIQESVTLIGQVNQLLTQITALGTDIWVKYVVGLIAPFSTGGSYPIATGLITYTLNLPASTGFYLLFTQLSKPINVWQTGNSPITFTLTTQAPTPSGTILNFLAIENSQPGIGIASINRGDLGYQVRADAVNNVVLFQGLWNNVAYYSGRSVNAINYNFTTPAPSGTQANYFAVPVSGQAFYQSVSANVLTLDVDITVDAQNIPYVMANWATTIGCLPDPTNNKCHLTFSVPAPPDASGEIAIVSYNINQAI
jgi:hypothetical protein